MNATDELAALWRACRAEPDDDTPRLVLADWLQENGDEARAELIRVQCELAANAEQAGLHQGNPEEQTVPCQACVYYGRLRARERDILAANADGWRKGLRCERCEGTGRKRFHEFNYGDPCPDCHGTGDAGGLMRKFRYYPDTEDGVGGPAEPVRVTYSRGLAVVTVPTLSECVKEVREDCKTCSAHRRRGPRSHLFNCLVCKNAAFVTRTVPSDWLRAVVTCHPDVIGVVPGDYRQYLGGGSTTKFWWRDTLCYDNDPRIPAAFCPKDNYDTPEAAVTALGRAVAAWARK